MHVEMVTRTCKIKRYKCLVYPTDLYYGLKDSPCCTEWIDVVISEFSKIFSYPMAAIEKHSKEPTLRDIM